MNSPLCPKCSAVMAELLDMRVRRILAVASEEADGEELDVARSQCFHIMELTNIVQGKPTCGVYDDYGKNGKTP